MFSLFYFSSRRRHTRFDCDWSSDVCSSDLTPYEYLGKDKRLEARFTAVTARKVRPTEVLVPAHNAPVAEGMLRSEERRVGKECRSRWSPYQQTKKTYSNGKSITHNRE